LVANFVLCRKALGVHEVAPDEDVPEEVGEFGTYVIPQ